MSAPMMNHSRRETLTHVPSVKRRKEREEGHPLNVSKPLPLTTRALAKPSPHHRPAPPTPKPVSNNQLLAGYLANEFLSKGTLFGQPWDPARAEAVPVTSTRLKPALNENKKQKVIAEPRESKPDEEKRVQKYQRYMEVADLFKTDGAHLPDMVNPTQLASFLQLG